MRIGCQGKIELNIAFSNYSRASPANLKLYKELAVVGVDLESTVSKGGIVTLEEVPHLNGKTVVFYIVPPASSELQTQRKSVSLDSNIPA